MEKNKIPTAEEYYHKNGGWEVMDWHTKKMMIEFAKLHVQDALKAASEKVILIDDVCEVLQKHWFEEYIDKDSILNTYPLENIK